MTTMLGSNEDARDGVMRYLNNLSAQVIEGPSEVFLPSAQGKELRQYSRWQRLVPFFRRQNLKQPIHRIKCRCETIYSNLV
jgi:hypothetical protein